MSVQASLLDPVCPLCRGSGRISEAQLAEHLENMPGAVGRDHPETSHRAAAPPRWGTQRYRVLRVLRDHGPQTAASIAGALNLSRNQTATRLGELREGALVKYLRNEAGQIVERATGAHDTGQVQCITDLGLIALRHAEVKQ